MGGTRTRIVIWTIVTFDVVALLYRYGFAAIAPLVPHQFVLFQ